MSDPTLLALVIDDPLAPRVLAFWRAKGPLIAERDDVLSELTIMVQSTSTKEVKTTVDRCLLAGLLLDGAISETAERWLGAHVGQRLGQKPKPTPKPKKPA